MTGDPQAIERVAHLAARLQELAEADVEFKVSVSTTNADSINPRFDEREVAIFE